MMCGVNFSIKTREISSKYSKKILLAYQSMETEWFVEFTINSTKMFRRKQFLRMRQLDQEL